MVAPLPSYCELHHYHAVYIERTTAVDRRFFATSQLSLSMWLEHPLSKFGNFRDRHGKTELCMALFLAARGI